MYALVTPETTLLQALDIFSQGLHRVAVMDAGANGKIHGVLTQSNVTDFLLKKLGDIPSSMKTVSGTLQFKILFNSYVITIKL